MNLKNPNALVGSGSGFIGGELIVNIAKQFGWDISLGWGLGIASVCTGVVLFIGKNGFVGLWNLLKFGSGGAPKAVG